MNSQQCLFREFPWSIVRGKNDFLWRDNEVEMFLYSAGMRYVDGMPLGYEQLLSASLYFSKVRRLKSMDLLTNVQ